MKIVYRAMAVAFVVWFAKTVAQRIRYSSHTSDHNQKIDRMLEESFPSSDAPSSWAGVGD